MSTKPATTADIVAGAARRGLDPFAVVSVANAEGLSGGIGDGGHAFGPWQLNDAGGSFPSAIQGTPEQKNAWAWSPAGVSYALDRIAAVAAGKHGQDAIVNIVGRFERPADPASEIARAGQTYRSLFASAGGNPSGIPTHAIAQGAGVVPNWIGGTNPDGSPKVVNPSPSAAGLGDVPGVSSVLDVGKFLGRLTDPSYLLRALQVLAGGGLVLTGVVLLARQVALAADLPDPAGLATKTGL